MRIKMKTKIRNRSNAFNINRSKLRQGHHRVIGKGGMRGGGGQEQISWSKFFFQVKSESIKILNVKNRLEFIF